MLTSPDATDIADLDITTYLPGYDLPNGKPFLYYYITPKQVKDYIIHHTGLGRSPQTVVKLLGMDQELLREYVRTYPEVGQAIRQAMGHRLVMLEDLAMQHARNGDAKILQALLTHAGWDKPEDSGSKRIYTDEQRQQKIERLLIKAGKALR